MPRSIPTGLARDYLAIEGSRADSQASELVQLRSQIAQREARLQADVDSYMRAGIDAEVVKSSARKQQDELTLLRRRCDDIERVLGNTADQAAALDRAARLARDAAGRLAAATLEERAEVIRQLDIRVVPLDDSRTPALRICGFVREVALAHDSHSSDVHPSSIEA